MANSSPCHLTKPDSKQNGHCKGSCSSETAQGASQDKEVSGLDCRAAVHINSQMKAEKLKHCEAMLPQQKEENPSEAFSLEEFLSAFSPVLDNSCGNHLATSVSASEDCSLDLLRIIKHKPSAIVFCDNECSTDNQVIINESSDGRESSSSTNEVVEGDSDKDDDDDILEALQYKEFLVSRRRRNLSTNRKCLRKRQDTQPNSTSGWQKPTNRGKPEFPGSQEEEDTPENNEKQVRKTRQEESDNKARDTGFSSLIQSVELPKETNSVAACIVYNTGDRHFSQQALDWKHRWHGSVQLKCPSNNSVTVCQHQ